MSKRILTVDDDPDILEVLAAMLEYYGYEVSGMLSADNILEHIQGFCPDIVLLDIMLSGADGRDVCKQLKANEGTKELPVIMVSASPGTRASMINCGANDYVPKPFDMAYLISRIEMHIR